MEYVEILRARRVLFWYAASLLGLLAIFLMSVYAGKGQAEFSGHGTVNISQIVLACAFGAWIVTTCVSVGLNAEGLTIPILWTRPMPRQLLAWRFVFVDVVAITIGYGFLFLVVLACCAVFGLFNRLVLDSETPVALAVGLGSALMWYGLIALVTARMSGRGALIAGLSWAAFLIIGAVWAAHLPPLLHGILTALNYLNPIAWVQGISSGRHGHADHPITFPVYVRALATWGIAFVTIALGVRLWSTREI